MPSKRFWKGEAAHYQAVAEQWQRLHYDEMHENDALREENARLEADNARLAAQLAFDRIQHATSSTTTA